MEIAAAQRDVRTTFVGGFNGQLVAGVLWLVAAAAGTWASPAWAMVTLLLGGTLIYPLTVLSLRLTGRAGSLPAGHPMAGLAMQLAFTVPVGLLVALAASGYRQEWFFPASMVIVGAHYLPFTFLYGMRLFALLAVLLVFGGVGLAYLALDPFSAGGWLGGATLVVFAFLLRSRAGGEN